MSYMSGSVGIRCRRAVLWTLWDNYSASAGDYVEQSVNLGFSKYTLYLKVDGACNVKIELSPDDGAHYYEAQTVSFSGAGDKIIVIDVIFNKIKLTVDSAVTITAQLVGIV